MKLLHHFYSTIGVRPFASAFGLAHVKTEVRKEDW